MTTGTPSLSLSLAHDTGSSATDGITRDGTFRVGNLQGARSWSWSKDHGASWNEGKSLRLKELRSDMLSATLAGGLIDSAKAATVSGWTVGTDLITAWLLIEDGRHTKGVKIEIGATASGTVQVKAVAAAYATGNHLADWATTSTWKRPVAFSDIDAGYGIKDLRIDGELIAPGYLAATATEVLASRFTLTDGKYAEGQVQVRKTLVDGSSVITGSTSAYQIDSAIGAPVIEKVASDDDVNAAEKAGGITLTGTADAQASVRIEWGDRSKTVVADAHGRWRVTYASFEVPADGRSRVKATATDTSGNTSAEAGRDVWIDPHGPEAKPVLLKASDDAGLSRWTVSASTATRIADTLGKSGKDAQVTVSAALTRDLTVEGWFKTDVPVSASSQQLFWLPGATSGSSVELLLRGGKLLTWASGGADSDIEGHTPDGNWHHYALSTDGAGNWRVHIDGVLVQTRSGPATLASGTFIATVGNHATASNSFQGLVGNVQLWDVQRSTAQIAQDRATVHGEGRDLAGAALSGLKGSWLLGARLDNEIAGGDAATRGATSSVARIERTTLSNDGTQTLSGTLGVDPVAGESIVILDGDTVLGTATLSGRNWTYATPVLGDGAHTLGASIRDAAGRLGSRLSTTYGVTIDTSAPTTTAELTSVAVVQNPALALGKFGEATRLANSTGKPVSDCVVTVKARVSLDLTVEGWFKTDTPVSDDTQQLFWLPGASKGSSYEVLLRKGQLLTWATDGADSIVASFVPDGLWHHVAVSTDGAGVWQLHVDGALLQTRSGPATPPAGGEDYLATIGNHAGTHAGNANSFHGLIGNVQVWDSQRSTADIARDLQTAYLGGKDGAGTVPAGLKGSWLLGASLANEVSGGSAASRATGSVSTPNALTIGGRDGIRTLEGTLGADLASGEALLILDGTQVLGTATVTGRSWTYTTPALGEGSHGFTARVRDAAGNLGPASKALDVDIAATAIAAPALQLAQDTGPGGNDGETSAATVQVIGLVSGTGWQWRVDGGSWVDGSGTSFEARSGKHAYAVRQFDAKGHASTASAELGVNLDNTAPLQTVQLGGIACTRVATATGLGGNHRITLSPAVAGDFTVEGWFKAADPAHADTQQLFWLSGMEVFVRKGQLMTWSSSTGDQVTGVVVDGQWHHYALGTDGAGKWTLHVDGVLQHSTTGGTIGASAAAQTVQIGNHHTGSNSLNGWVGNVQVWDRQRSTGQISQDMALIYRGGKGALDRLAVDLKGSWLLGASLANEVAGGVDAVRAPGASAVEVERGYLHDPRPTLTGTLSAELAVGETLLILDGSTVLGTAVVTGRNWTFSLDSALRGGSHDLRAQVQDAAGNVGALSNRLDAKVDLAIPGLSLKTDSGSHASDGITRIGKALAGGIETGNHWQYRIDGGAWKDRGLDVHLKDLDARRINATLNGGWIKADTIAQAVDWQWTGETATTWLLIVHDGMTKGVRIELFENAAGAMQARVIAAAYTSGDHVKDWASVARTDAPLAQADGAEGYGVKVLTLFGTVVSERYVTPTAMDLVRTRDVSLDLIEGLHTYEVRQLDPAGNVSAPSKPVSYTLDTSGPNLAPTLVLAHDGGSSANDRITSVRRAHVTGLDKDSDWEYSTDKGASWIAGSRDSFRPSLNDIQVDRITATLNGKAIGRDLQVMAVGLSVTSSSSHHGRSFWLIAFDGGYTKGVKCEFTTAADGTLQARILYGGFMEGWHLHDWTVKATGSTLKGQWIADGPDGTGNGVKSLAYEGVRFGDGYLSQSKVTALNESRTFELGEGTLDYLVRQVDAAGNPGPASPAVTVQTRLARLATPTLKLSLDSGSSDADHITQSTWVLVDGLSGNRWEYSLDAGANWTRRTILLSELTADMFSGTLGGALIGSSVQGQVTGVERGINVVSFWLVHDSGTHTRGVRVQLNGQPEGLVAKAVYAVEIDGAHVSDWMSVVDSPAARSRVIVESDAGAGLGIKALKVRGVSFGGNFLSSSKHTVADGPILGDGNHFSLPEAVYAPGQIQVRQFDASAEGKLSEPGVNHATWTIDSSVRMPTLGDIDVVSGNVPVLGLSEGGVWKFRIDGGPWSTGYGSSIPARHGSHVYEAHQTDVAGNVSAISPPRTFKPQWIDRLALADDAGFVNTDGLSKVGLIRVFQLGTSAWRYSIDGGQSWVQGHTDDSPVLERYFRLAEGSYAVGQIRVQRAVADTSADTGAGAGAGAVEYQLIFINDLAVTIDQTLATPRLQADPDRAGLIHVHGLERGGIWSWRVDDGEWNVGFGNSFEAQAGTHGYTVRQSDAAGNEATSGMPLRYAGRQTAATLQLASDTGIVHSDGTVLGDHDGITRLAGVNISNVRSGNRWQYKIDSGEWRDPSFAIGLKDLAAAGITATLNGRAIQADMPATAVDWQVSGKTVTTWLVFFDSNYTKGVQVELSENASGALQVRALSAAYTPGEHLADWTTVTRYDAPLATGDDTSGYGVKRLMVFGVEVTSGYLDTVADEIVVQRAQGLFLLEGQHSYVARELDAGGNVVGIGAPVTYTWDTTAPARPAANLQIDSGIDRHDGLTRHARAHVIGIEDGASWQIQVDGGEWKNGGTPPDKSAEPHGFDLLEGRHTYALRQTDAAGHVSAASTSATYTLDTQAPTDAPKLVLHRAKPGAAAGSTLQVGGLAADAGWSYQIDGGAWVDGKGTELALLPGQHVYGVRQQDAAGNTGPIASVEVGVESPQLALRADTGSGDRDGYTRLPSVQVDGVTQGAVWQFQIDGGTWTGGVHEGRLKEITPLQVRATLNGADIRADSLAQAVGWQQVGETVTTWLVFVNRDFSGDVSGNVSGDVTRGVKVELSENSAGAMQARVLAAARASGDHVTDWLHVAKTDLPVATGDKVQGLGVKSLQLNGTVVTPGGAYLGVDLTQLSGHRQGSRFDLQEGQHDYVVRQLDDAGTVIATSATVRYTLDTSAPAMPVLSLDAETHDVASTGYSKAGRILVGGLEANSTWQYRIDGGSWVTGSGEILWARPGNHLYEVRTLDAAGNVSVSPNLLRNGDFEKGNTGFTSDYTGTGPAGPGTYGVQTALPGLGLAHAGVKGGQGQFLMVDGATDASRRVWSQQVELKAGKIYDFGAIALANAGVDLQLMVDGKDVGTSFQPREGTDWQPWTLRFLSTTTGTVTLAIRDRGTSTSSNDFALDNLTLRRVEGLEVNTRSLTLALKEDTGQDDKDGVTRVSEILVNGLGDAQAWQWRADGGTWQAGTNRSFQALAGKHAYEVRGRQADDFGASSDALLVRLDDEAPSFDNQALHIAAVPGGASRASAAVPISSSGGACVAFWAKALTGTKASTQLLATNGKFGDVSYENGKLALDLNGVRLYATAQGSGSDLAADGTAALDTEWHHYAVNIDETGHVSVHLDGRQVLRHAATIAGAFSEVDLTFGAHHLLNDRGWGGDFLNIQVRDTSRTTQQIMSDAMDLIEPGAASADLKAWWLNGKPTLPGTPDLKLLGQAGQADLFKVLTLKSPSPGRNLISDGEIDDPSGSARGDYTLRPSVQGSGTNAVMHTAPEWGLGIQKGRGDGGTFLMVDGANDASKLAWSQVIRLEVGETYDFSGQVAANDGVVLQLTLNGVDLGPTFTPKSGAGWQAWRHSFTSAFNGPQVLGIRDLTTRPDSNDFALDSLSLQRVADGWRGYASTRDGQILVHGLPSYVRWQWRIDGGDWRAGDTKTPEFKAATGRHAYQVRLVDTAGNAGPASAEFKVDHDDARPTLVSNRTVSVHDAITSSAFSAAGQTFTGVGTSAMFKDLDAAWTIDADKPVTLTGRYAPHESVQVFINGAQQPVVVTSTSSLGMWSVTLLPEAMRQVPIGRSRVDVRVADEAGNVSSNAQSFMLVRTPALGRLDNIGGNLSSAEPSPDTSIRKTVFRDQMKDSAKAVSYTAGMKDLGFDPGRPPSGDRILLGYSGGGDDDVPIWQRTVTDLPRDTVLKFTYMLCTGLAQQSLLPRIALFANGTQLGAATMLPQTSRWTQVSIDFIKTDDGPLTLALANTRYNKTQDIFFAVDDIVLSHGELAAQPAEPGSLLDSGTFESGSSRPQDGDGIRHLPDGSVLPQLGEAASVKDAPSAWHLGSAKAHGDERFLAVHSKGGGQTVWRDTVTTEPGATLSLTFWVTTDDVSVPQLRVKVDGQVVSAITTSAIERSQGWTQIQLTFTAPIGKTSMRLSLEDMSAGGARFGLDDIALKQLGKAKDAGKTTASDDPASDASTPAPDPLRPGEQNEVLTSDIVTLLERLRKATTDSDVLVAFGNYLNKQRTISTPNFSVPVKPFVNQLTEQVIDDRWRGLARTILKTRSAEVTREAVMDDYAELRYLFPGMSHQDALSQAKLDFTAKARNEFLGKTARMFGQAWLHASGYALGAQIGAYNQTGDKAADDQATLRLANAVLTEVAILIFFLPLGDTPMRSWMSKVTSAPAPKITQIGVTTAFSMIALMTPLSITNIGMNFEKSQKMPAGHDRDLATTRNVFDLISAVASLFTNAGLGYGTWNAGRPEAMIKQRNTEYYGAYGLYKSHEGRSNDHLAYTSDITERFEAEYSTRIRARTAIEKIALISGAIQSISSIISLSTYFGDKSLTESQKIALGVTLGLDVSSAVFGALGTIYLQKAIAQGASALKIGGLTGMMAIVSLATYINPLQIEQMSKLFENGYKMRDIADSMGRKELGYSGDHALADLFLSQAKMEVSIYSAQFGLAAVSTAFSLVGGPIGWAVTLITSLVSIVIEAIRQPILEGIADAKRQEMLNESGGDLHAYYKKGLEASYAKMLKDPHVIDFFKTQLTSGEFDQVIGLISVNQDNAMRNTAALTKTSEFLPQWQLFTAEMDKSKNLTDSSKKRIDLEHTRIDASSQAENQKIIMVTPLMPYGESTSVRYKITDTNYQTRLTRLQQSGWTINDGSSSSVIDLGNVVAVHMSPAFNMQEQIYYTLRKYVDEWFTDNVGRPHNDFLPAVVKNAIKNTTSNQNATKYGTEKWVEYLTQTGEISQYYREIFTSLDPWSGDTNEAAKRYGFKTTPTMGGAGVANIVSKTPDWKLGSQLARDGTGKFLLADGSTNSDSKAWSQQIEMIAGDRMEFEAQVMSNHWVKLQLTVNGIDVGEPFEPTPDKGWQLWRTSFDNPASGKVTLGIRDLGIFKPYNDFALDDLTLRKSATSSVAMNLIRNGNFDNADQPGYSSDYTLKAGTSLVPGEHGRFSSAIGWGLGIDGDIAGTSGNFLLFDGATQAGQQAWTQTVEVKAGMSYDFHACVASNGESDLQLTVDGRNVGTSFQPTAGAGWLRWRTTFDNDITGTVTLAIRNKNTRSEKNDFAIDGLSLTPNLITNGGFDDVRKFSTDYRSMVKVSDISDVLNTNFVATTQVNADAGDDIIVPGMGEFVINGGAGNDLVDYSGNSDAATSLILYYSGSQIVVEKHNMIGTLNASGLGSSNSTYGKRTDLTEYLDIYKIDNIRIDTRALVDHLSNVELVKGSAGADHFVGDIGDQFFACNDLRDRFSGGGGTDVVDLHQLARTHFDFSDLSANFREIDLLIFGDTHNLRTTVLGGETADAPTMVYGNGRDTVDAKAMKRTGAHVQKVAVEPLSGLVVQGSDLDDIVDYSVAVANQTFSEFKATTGSGNDVVSLRWSGSLDGNRLAQDTLIQLGTGNDTLYLDLGLAMSATSATQVVHAEGGEGSDILFASGSQGMVYDDAISPDLLTMGSIRIQATGFESIKGTAHDDVFMMTDGKSRAARYYYGSAGNDIYLGSTRAAETLDYSIDDKGLNLSVISGSKVRAVGENTQDTTSKLPLQKVGVANIDVIIGSTRDDTILAGNGGEHYELGLGNDVFSAARTGSASARLGLGDDSAYFLGGTLNIDGGQGRDRFVQGSSAGLNTEQLEALQNEDSQVWLVADGGDTVHLSASNFAQTIHIENQGRDWGKLDVHFEDDQSMMNQFLWFKDSDQKTLLGIWSPSRSDEDIKTTYLKLLEFSLDDVPVNLHFKDGTRSTKEIADSAYENKNLIEPRTLQGLDRSLHESKQFDDTATVYLGHGEDYLFRMLVTQDYVMGQASRGIVS